jgi:geranylgeranyl diphosphate synthase type II
MYKKLFEDYLSKYPFPGYFTDGIKYIISDGHRIRPQLLLSWCELCGGEKEKALPAALSIELLHVASLIQDDLPCMDNAEMRKGKTAFHKIVGDATTILYSNVLIGLSFSLVADLDTSQANKDLITKILFNSAHRMCKGQLIELENLQYSIEDWEEICEDKTAALLVAACEIGAILAEASLKDIMDAIQYGYYLGMGYQLADDLQDRDGAASILSKQEIEVKLQNYVSNLKVEGDSEAAIFLNAVAQKALLRN